MTRKTPNQDKLDKWSYEKILCEKGGHSFLLRFSLNHQVETKCLIMGDVTRKFTTDIPLPDQPHHHLPVYQGPLFVIESETDLDLLAGSQAMVALNL